MSLFIRRAGKEDLRHILAIYAELETDTGAVLSPSCANDIFDRMCSYPDYKIYIACAGEEIVGTFSLAIMDNIAHMGMPSGLIEDVVVKSSWRGKGIGKEMMRFALDRCKEAGCYKSALSSNIIREDAHRFYESLGFVKHGYSFLIDLK